MRSWLSVKGLSQNMAPEGGVPLSASPNPETVTEQKKGRDRPFPSYPHC